MSKEEIIKIEGFGEITANYLKTIFNSWAEKGVNLYKVAAASNKFERMGEKLLAEIPHEYYFEDIFSKKEFLKEIPGFGDIRVESFINNLPQFISFINKLPIKIIKPEKKEESLFFISNKCEGVKVVFTQFRDLELEQLIFLNGGQLLDHINKKATHLLVKEKNKGTKKELKAIQLNVPIWTKEEFLNFYNL
jgi:NAD-dependent DNA ligase